MLPTMDELLSALQQKGQAEKDESIIDLAIFLLDSGRYGRAINYLLYNMGFNVSRDGRLMQNGKDKLSLEAWLVALEIIEENYDKPIATEPGSFNYYSKLMRQLGKRKSLMEQVEVSAGHD